MLRYDLAGRTDRGCVRANNEDSLAVELSLGLLVVADGMGGHNSGEVASRLAVEAVVGCVRGRREGRASGNPALEGCVQEANALIYERARAFARDKGMGTTVVAVLLGRDSAAVAHVGDSRLYLLRGGRLETLTEDHSLAMEQMRRGALAPEAVEDSGLQNILTRALGTQPRVVVDAREQPLLPGDALLLCTDGLNKMLSDDRIAALLGRAPDASSACDGLVEEARRAGGVDNVTVAVARALPRGRMRRVLDRFLGRG